MFKNREEFEEALSKSVKGMEEELKKARDPFTDFPSKQPESAVDKKSREVTDKMRERAGAKDKLVSEVKAGKQHPWGNAEYRDPKKTVWADDNDHGTHLPPKVEYFRNEEDGQVYGRYLEGKHKGMHDPTDYSENDKPPKHSYNDHIDDFRKKNPHVPAIGSHEDVATDFWRSHNQYEKTGKAIEYPKDKWSSSSMKVKD